MKFSDKAINAYADGELQNHEKAEFENALQKDPELQLALNNVYETKKQLHNAYKHTENHDNTHKKNTINSRVASYAIILLLTFSGGWISSDLIHNTSHIKAQQASISSQQINTPVYKQGKYIIHINKHDDDMFKKTLNKIESLLTSNEQMNNQLELEIVANAGGLDLLRVGATPYTHKIQQLIKDYPNIKFIACANAIERLQEQGMQPNLIKAVRHDTTTAIDQVIRRVHDGWTYIKV